MTIGFRYMILGKGVNWKQGLAAFVVMVGIFIALIPNIFYTHSDDANGAQSESAAARILWPVSSPCPCPCRCRIVHRLIHVGANLCSCAS